MNLKTELAVRIVTDFMAERRRSGAKEHFARFISGEKFPNRSANQDLRGGPLYCEQIYRGSKTLVDILVQAEMAPSKSKPGVHKRPGGGD